MADEQSNFNDLYFDDLKKLRVLEPEVILQTNELKEECKEFVEKTEEFQQLAGDLIKLAKQLSSEVEREKLKAIAYKNMLQTFNDDQKAKRQQIGILIAEKKSYLERLYIQHASLKKMEAEQKELIEQLQYHI